MNTRILTATALGLLAVLSATAATANGRRDYVAPRAHVSVDVAAYPARGGFAYRPYYGPRFGGYAPRGLYFSVLPPLYTTVWFGGIPYYYADDVYYTWRSDIGTYEVVSPPDAVQPSTAAPAPSSGNDLFLYPKDGQSDEQQAKDRYECHSWASGQSGFDPTQAAGGVQPADAASKRADYLRAMTACLDARGYSVK